MLADQLAFYLNKQKIEKTPIIKAEFQAKKISK